MIRVELVEARSVAIDDEPDERGNLSILVMLDGERVTALPGNAN